MVAFDPETSYPVNFVYSCPPCMPAVDAFRAYRQRPKFLGDKAESDNFGKGLSDELRTRLLGSDAAARRSAVQTLVEGWLRRYLDALRLTDVERAAWDAQMEEFRKKGMAQLEAMRASGAPGAFVDMEECPSCEAVNDATERG